LALFSNEIQLFSQKEIYPFHGIGKSPDDEKFKISVYQLGVKNYPHLNDNGCTIYSKRPLACKSYPFEPFRIAPDGEIQLTFDVECTGILELQGRNPSEFADGKISAPVELRYCLILLEKVAKIQQEEELKWSFDLQTKKWKQDKIIKIK